MIHKFERNGQYFVLDIESGTVLEVDAISYALLGEHNLNPVDSLDLEFDRKELEEAYEEISSLIEEGLLYSKPVLEDSVSLNGSGIKALCLHVAHDCNLRCSYCFAGQGDFTRERSLMSLETAKAAIDFVIRESGARKNIEIDFFGGEPLMNLDVVKETINYARERAEQTGKEFHFTLTTNGLLLNKETREYLDKELDNIVLSLDGREEVNDRFRKTVSGDGSYAVIIDNIKEMAKLREGKKDYYVRGTFTRHNMDFLEDVRSIYEQGIHSISVEPVVAEDGSGYELFEEDLDKIKEEYRKLAAYNLENDFTFFHFNIDLDGGPCLYKRVSGCGAGTDYLAVTPEGDLYPCHQFVSNEDFKIGSVYDGLEDTSVLADFKEADIRHKEACRECWCRYFCGGGCHANAFNFNHTVKEPYSLACELEKERVEDAILLYSLRKSN